MRVQKISNQPINKNSKVNNQPAFGMYFKVEPEVVDTYIKGVNSLSHRISIDPYYPIRLIRNVLRDIIEHNKTPQNHYVYDNTVNIFKIDLVSTDQNARNASPKLMGRSFLYSEPAIKSELQNPASHYGSRLVLITDRGQEFSGFGTGDSVKAMQDRIVDMNNNMNQATIMQDINYLVNKNKSIK